MTARKLRQLADRAEAHAAWVAGCGAAKSLVSCWAWRWQC